MNIVEEIISWHQKELFYNMSLNQDCSRLADSKWYKIA